MSKLNKVKRFFMRRLHRYVLFQELYLGTIGNPLIPSNLCKSLKELNLFCHDSSHISLETSIRSLEFVQIFCVLIPFSYYGYLCSRILYTSVEEFFPFCHNPYNAMDLWENTQGGNCHNSIPVLKPLPCNALRTGLDFNLKSQKSILPAVSALESASNGRRPLATCLTRESEHLLNY